jgi:arsenite-transporting ATPase
VLLHYDPVRVARSGAQYTLTIDLPFATKEALSVTRSPSEVFIRVGPYRRSVLLVDSLKKREVVGARLKNGKLVVRFQ